MKKTLLIIIVLSIMSCSSEADKLKAELENCETEKTQLNNKVTEYENKINDLENEVSNLESQVSNLESELDDCVTKFKRYKSDSEFENQMNRLNQ